MLSKIKIALDHDNHPIIKIEWNNSEDVRDDMVKRFLEAFGGDSSWALFSFTHSGLIQGHQSAYLRPIHPTDLPKELPIFTERAMAHQKLQATQNKQFPGMWSDPEKNI